MMCSVLREMFKGFRTAAWVGVVGGALSASGADGVWTYAKELDSTKIDWTDTTKWQDGTVPNGADDTAALGNVAADLGNAIQIVNVPNVANRSYNNDEMAGLTLRSLTGLANQRIRQRDGIKSLTEVLDPSDFLGLWLTDTVYSGLKVTATADATVPQVSAGNMFELNLPNAGVKTTVGKIRNVGTMIKKGPGDLAITDAGADATTLRLTGAGSLSLGRDKSKDAQPVAGAWLHLDASRTNTMTFVAGDDGKTYISRWNDCDGKSAYAEQTRAITGSATNRPFLRLDYLNGKPVVDFGAFFGSNIDFDVYDHDVTTYGETAWMDVKNQRIPRTAFVVMQEVRADHCDAVPVGNTGSAVWYRYNARKDKVRYAGVPFGDTYGSFCWYRDGVSLNGRQVETGRKMNLTEWTVWAIPYTGNTYFNTLMRDRIYRYGGARVAEILAYETALSEDEMRQNIAYLKNKWLKGVTAEGEDVDLGTAVVEDAGVTFNVDAGKSAKIARVENAAEVPLVKTGAGTLAIENVGASKPVDFDIQGGTVRLEDTAPNAATDVPAANPMVWLAADAGAACFDFVTENGTNFVKRWYDVRSDHRTEFALNDGGVIGTKRTFRKPWLDTTRTLNGKPIVNFGTFVSAMDANNNGQGAALRFCTKLQPREAFIVWCDDKDSGSATWIFGSDGVGNNGFVRSIQSNRKRLVAEEYAPGYVTGGRWSVDGRMINPMDINLPLGEFVVIDCALEKGCPADYLGTDRPDTYARSGGCQIAEVLYYDRELTDKERRDTQAYLLKKWKNLEHPDNVALKIGSVTGSGTLEIARAVEPVMGEVQAKHLVATADLRFDASDTSTMTLEGDKILEWRDANGGDKKLVATSTVYTPNRPKLISATINTVEKKAVSLSGLTKSPASSGGKKKLAATDGNGTSFDLCGSNGTLTSGTYRHFFIVMSDCNDACTTSCDHRAALIDSTWDANPVFYRDTGNNGQLIRNTYAGNEAYTSDYWMDGRLLDFGWDNKVAKKNVKVTDFNYHVYAIAASVGVKIDHVGVWLDNGNICYYGGKNICEMLCYTQPLTADECAVVNKYLQDKWQAQGAVYTAALPSNVVLAGGSLDVGTKTDVTLAAGVSAVGRISAKSVAASSAMAFDFTAPDVCGKLEVEGTFVWGETGTITVGGAFKPETGAYPLVTATTFTGAANLANWKLVNNTAGQRNPMSLKVVGNTLTLAVNPLGLTIIIR